LCDNILIYNSQKNCFDVMWIWVTIILNAIKKVFLKTISWSQHLTIDIKILSKTSETIGASFMPLINVIPYICVCVIDIIKLMLCGCCLFCCCCLLFSIICFLCFMSAKCNSKDEVWDRNEDQRWVCVVLISEKYINLNEYRKILFDSSFNSSINVFFWNKSKMKLPTIRKLYLVLSIFY
jgi:hypothetical protein